MILSIISAIGYRFYELRWAFFWIGVWAGGLGLDILLLYLMQRRRW